MSYHKKQDLRIDVLKLIWKRKQISRAELSRQTGLTRPTISLIVTELLDLGLVSDIGKGESSGGKRPNLFSLNSDALCAIGIDLADENCIRGVVTNLDGIIIRKHEAPYENVFENLYEQTATVIRALLASTEISKIQGIGLSVSGVVDASKNDVIHSSNFDIENKQIADKLTGEFGLPVYLANRPNAAALAEKIYGIGRNYSNLVYLTTGQGVGAGIIANGRIFSGSFGCAGEIGKLILDPNQQIPDYPNDCTLEYRTRANYIIKEVQKSSGQPLSYAELLERFEQGDKLVEEKVFENATYLAYGASIIANVINPQLVILGGRVKDFGPKYFTFFKEKFYNLLMVPQSSQQGRTEIQVSEFGSDGIAFGGAVLILNKIFNLELSDLNTSGTT